MFIIYTVRGCSFSCGYSFLYWEYYKEVLEHDMSFMSVPGHGPIFGGNIQLRCLSAL